MSIVVRFTSAPGMRDDQYDEVVRRLQESESTWPPDGMAYHVAFKLGDSFRVSEIWDSPEQLEAFGERLLPLLAEHGVELAGEPEIAEIYNIISR
jgi:hypothetical protein